MYILYHILPLPPYLYKYCPSQNLIEVLDIYNFQCRNQIEMQWEKDSIKSYSWNKKTCKQKN